MSQGNANIIVDHQALDKAARDIDRCRAELAEILNNAHNEMESVIQAMASRSGERLIERFNNLTRLYFDRYIQSMEEHAIYLNQAAIDYEAADDTLKGRAEGALAHFENV